jgi:hypothetical protein
MKLHQGFIVAMALGVTTLLSNTAAFAEDDCFNGPGVTVDGAQRGQISVPPGQAVRLTFNFNAAWENIVYVCDALTGHRIEEKGNYRHNREDWVSPIDNTRSLTYFVVGFHKTVPQNDANAFRRPWLQSKLKRGETVAVEGQSGAYVVPYGFNDGGGNGWDNALVTAYFMGHVGPPGGLPVATLRKIQSNFAPR